MTKGIELLVMGLGGLSLFVCAFLGFAAMSGTPLTELAVIGPMFAEEEDPEEELQELLGDSGPSQVVSTAKQVIEANIGILKAYALEPPFTPEELQTLTTNLKTAKLGYDERMRKLDEREVSIEQREELLTDQFTALEDIRNELERYEADLTLRSAEVGRDENVAEETEAARWAEVANLFASGDADELSKRLLRYDAAEAAHILINLDNDRATTLLNALPDDKWKSYVDAYSDMGQ